SNCSMNRSILPASILERSRTSLIRPTAAQDYSIPTGLSATVQDEPELVLTPGRYLKSDASCSRGTRRGLDPSLQQSSEGARAAAGEGRPGAAEVGADEWEGHPARPGPAHEELEGRRIARRLGRRPLAVHVLGDGVRHRSELDADEMIARRRRVGPAADGDL